MASLITPVSAIVGGKINFKLKVRLIHMWRIPDFNKPGEDQCVHMLLLDERLGKIQATAKKTLVQKVTKTVQEGEVYEIENMLVALNDVAYAATNHRFKINFLATTKFARVAESTIPKNHFDFMSFQEILDCEKEDKFLDVIGHIVEKDPIKETEKNGSSLEEYPTMPQPYSALLSASGNRLIFDELNYDRQMLSEEHDRLMSTMTLEQRRVYDNH